MELIIDILKIVVCIGSAIVCIWSMTKATKEHDKGVNLNAIYYMLFAIFFLLINRLR